MLYAKRFEADLYFLVVSRETKMEFLLPAVFHVKHLVGFFVGLFHVKQIFARFAINCST